MPVTLKNLSFGFGPSRPILDDVSLSLESQKIYSLMGPNGSGKTTFFNLISGFIKPQRGEITFRGARLHRMEPYRINRMGVGRTFQDLRLITRLTVKGNMLLAPHDDPTSRWYGALLPSALRGDLTRSIEAKAAGIIDDFFLGEVVARPAGEISFGQQKLLTLACCVMNNAEVLLLDEPVAGINPEYSSKIGGLLKKIRAAGRTILLIEHNTEFIREVSDHCFFLSGGKLRSFESFDDLRNDSEVIESYI